MSMESVRQVHLPYCIHREADGSYVVLNREYKPVGFNTKESIQYADYPIRVKLRGLGPAVAARIDCEGHR